VNVSPKNSTTVRTNPVPWSVRAAVRIGALVAPDATTERALELFCTPLSSSRTRAEHAALEGAVVERLRVGDQRIAVYHWGDLATQPRVLLSHGWSSFGLRFAPWVAHLRALGYSVIAFDQPGHGRNERARITLPGFVDTLLAIGQAHGPFAAAIGHSLGGAAIAAAMSEGLKVGRVVLLAPAADAVSASKRFSRAIALPEPRRAAMQARLERSTGRSMDSLAIHRIGPQLAQPALVIHDFADTDVPWDEGERYARFWPHARLLSVSGLGHHKIVNDPAVIAAGLNFLKGEAVGERVVSTQQLIYGLA
jgi:pimeloyl-ACP methyl ester carboxylesterase